LQINTFDDIKVKEEENAMRKSECQRMALWWLAELRRGTLAYGDAIGAIRKYLREGGITLAEIGSSEAELEKGRVRGCTIYARYLLKGLRRGTTMYKTYVLGLKQCLKKAGLQPEAIGSTGSEIDAFLEVSETTFKSRLKEPITFRKPFVYD
jgi:hypothetical protein